jgi:hypothetical protein
MNSISTLASLEYLPYLNEAGETTEAFASKVGVYAIFDQAKILQFIGFSRDVSLSLKQHLVRQPEGCYWLKVQTIDRPSRTILEEIRSAWISENGATPVGNDTAEALWNQPIDAKSQMTDEEKDTYAAMDELGKMKTLKQAARRVEAEVLVQLAQRGVKMSLRFDPKLKEEGLLGLK